MVVLKLLELFNKINKCEAKIVLKHKLFDEQVCYCKQLHILNDENRVGVVIKNQEIFVNKQDIKLLEYSNDIFAIADDMLSILIYVNKL